MSSQCKAHHGHRQVSYSLCVSSTVPTLPFQQRHRACHTCNHLRPHRCTGFASTGPIHGISPTFAALRCASLRPSLRPRNVPSSSRPASKPLLLVRSTHVTPSDAIHRWRASLVASSHSQSVLSSCFSCSYVSTAIASDTQSISVPISPSSTISCNALCSSTTTIQRGANTLALLS